MPSTSFADCRLLVHPPGDGAWNMAADEFLLDCASTSGHCCWRFYQWSKPTLSLGYFQLYSERWNHAPSRCCPVVRRTSGGGAILHDHELTYSLAVPIDHPLARRRQWTYETIHQTLIDTLSAWGLSASLFGSVGREEEKKSEFLCFNRRSTGDVVIENTKIAGSAQRRTAGAVLQHGSVLLRGSAAAPELPGLREATGRAIGADELRIAWEDRVAEVLLFRWQEDSLARDEEDRIGRIVAEKYGCSSWTEKERSRNPPE